LLSLAAAYPYLVVAAAIDGSLPSSIVYLPGCLFLHFILCALRVRERI